MTLATDIITALGLQGPIHNHLTCATQILQNMAQQVPPGLWEADIALIEILNRMENKDNTMKKFPMFPKNAFNGKSKQAAKNHWLEFEKYMTYQQQHEFLDLDDDDQFLEVCNRLKDVNKWWVGIRSAFPLFLSSSGYNVCHSKVVTPI